MKATIVFAVVSATAVFACGDALGPGDSVDMIGTWEAKATPRGTGRSYECRVEDLTLVLTPPPADTVASPGSFFGTTSGGEATCLSWGPHPLQPGVVRGRAFFNDEVGAWRLDLYVIIEEQQFRLSLMTEIENTSHIEGVGAMGAGGAYREFCDLTGDCQSRTYTFYVDVTLMRQ